VAVPGIAHVARSADRIKRQGKSMKKKAIIKVLRNLVDYAGINHCCHENTYRGGVLWEICEECGAKWADDQGGKPADAGELPEELREAVELLGRLEK
jgi:hypothetical protein